MNKSMFTKHIPNTITSLNLLCGVLGIVFAVGGNITLAFCLMLAGAVCDFCDGLSARLLGAYSKIGLQLDSLADVVTFGVLPAVMLHQLMVSCTFSSGILTYVPLVLAASAAIRLAKFNVDDRQEHSFLGLATPVCALLCGGLCYYVAVRSTSIIALWCSAPLFIPVLALCLCVLMHVELPMFSLKFSKQDSKSLLAKRISFLAECLLIVAAVLVVGENWALAVVLCCLLYILKNLLYAILKA